MCARVCECVCARVSPCGNPLRAYMRVCAGLLGIRVIRFIMVIKVIRFVRVIEVIRVIKVIKSPCGGQILQWELRDRVSRPGARGLSIEGGEGGGGGEKGA